MTDTRYDNLISSMGSFNKSCDKDDDMDYIKTYPFISQNKPDDYPSVYSSENFDLNNNGMNRKEVRDSRLIITTRDNINFNVFINSTTCIIDSDYINKFCHFMDSRTEDQTVKLHLGAWLTDIFWIQIGSIISSMIECKANVITYAGGACGTTESVLWLFGKSREIGKYGMLSYSLGPYMKNSNLSVYMDIIFQRAKDIFILSDENIVNLKKNKLIQLFGDEVINKIAQSTNEEEVVPVIEEPEVQSGLVVDNDEIQEVVPDSNEQEISNESWYFEVKSKR